MVNRGRPWVGVTDHDVVRQMILDEEPCVSLSEMALAGQRRGPWPGDLDPTPYNELRRVIQLVFLRGASLHAVADIFGLARTSVYRWAKEERGTAKSNVT